MMSKPYPLFLVMILSLLEVPLDASSSCDISATPAWSAIPVTIDRIRKRDDYWYTEGVGIHKLHNKAECWNEARKICEEEGGHLAIVNSAAEATTIGKILGSTVSNPRWAFVGFHDLYKEGEYLTIRGQTLPKAGYTGWANNQPDNAGGVEHCGTINSSGKLNDWPCGTAIPFVCELSYFGNYDY